MMIKLLCLLLLVGATFCSSSEDLSVDPLNSYLGELSLRAEFPTDTPICTNRTDLDFGIVLFPNEANMTCAESNLEIRPYTIWAGAQFGDCIPLQWCRSNCDAVRECGSQGLSMIEYNECYVNHTGSCTWEKSS